MSLDKWIPGYKARRTKEVNYDRNNFISYSETKEEYSNEYIKQVIEKDPWIFDPRFQKIWIQSEFLHAYENDDWHTNSGHFSYIAPFWRKNGGSKEELYYVIKANAKKYLKALLNYFKDDLKRDMKVMKDYAKSRDMEHTEIWKEHSLDYWRTVNMIRRELNIPLMPMPDILKLSVREIVIKTLEEQKLEIDQKI